MRVVAPTRRLRAGVALLAGLVAVAAVGCGSQASDRLRASTAELRIQRALASTYQLAVDRVRCPAVIDLRKGGTFRCSARVAGQSLRVQATQRTDRGDLSVAPLDAVIRPDQVGQDLNRRLDAQFGRPFTVDCGDPSPRVLRPGATFSCTAADATSRRTITVKVVDAAGSVTYDVGSDAAPGGAATVPPGGAATAPPTTVPPGGAATAPPTAAPTTPP